jgi:hypothetical protein
VKLDPDDYDAIAGAFFESEGREPSEAEVYEEATNRYAYMADHQRNVTREAAWNSACNND